MDAEMRLGHLCALAAILMTGCGPDESGVITNKAPFYSQTFHLPLRDGPKIVAETREFARRRGIKLLVATQHFREGEFTTLLITDNLNIGNGNVATDNRAWVTAVARGDPTDRDRALINEYLRFVSLGPPTGERQPEIILPNRRGRRGKPGGTRPS